MLIGKYEIGARIIAMVVGGLILVAAVAFGITQCDKRRDQAAQSRVDGAQAGAQQNSAGDAINTVSNAAQREADALELGRTNEREIRAADGAGERVKPGVDYAGRAALCRREAYRNDPKCKVMKP